MKIGSKGISQDVLRVLSETSTQSTTQQAPTDGALQILKGGGDETDPLADIMLSQAIQAHLNPSVLDAERRARVEEVAKRYRSGQ